MRMSTLCPPTMRMPHVYYAPNMHIPCAYYQCVPWAYYGAYHAPAMGVAHVTDHVSPMHLPCADHAPSMYRLCADYMLPCACYTPTIGLLRAHPAHTMRLLCAYL